MTGEIEFFRKRFVGGFNRQDVINYITKLAQERNDFREAKEKAEQDALALSAEVDGLRDEVEKVRREGREYRVAALDAAVNTFTDLESAFGNLCSDMETTTESIFTELDQARRTISSLPDVLKRAGDGIKLLKSACETEKDATLVTITGGLEDKGAAADGE